jgi:LacI family transcriptional regulator
MSTIKEVARKAAVSVGTVSNVISGAVPVSPELRDRVWSTVRQLGYEPDHVARSLKLRRTMTLGMIISDITNPFFAQLVRGAEDAALEHNYLLLTFNTDERPEREDYVLSVLRSRRVDGILLVVAPGKDRRAHITETRKSGTPIVCLDRLPPGVKVDSVTVNNIRAARDCVRHLVGQGHRKIAVITGSLTLQTARQRLRGYERALSEAGIPADPRLVRHGDFRAESGHKTALELLSSPERPSALFVSNGMMALGALKAIEELGLRCPEDVALAVFDDLPVAEVIRPQLTSVAQPAYLMGYRGAEILMQRIAEKKGKKKAVKTINLRLLAELKVRESTVGRYPQAGLFTDQRQEPNADGGEHADKSGSLRGERHSCGHSDG